MSPVEHFGAAPLWFCLGMGAAGGIAFLAQLALRVFDWWQRGKAVG
jgi:hypothetical protein